MSSKICFFYLFNIARFKRIKGIKRLRQMLLKTLFRNIWEQTDEKKLYLVWRDKSSEIKFASERCSQQGIKGVKLIPFAKNHYSALLRSKSWKETISKWGDESNEIKFYSERSSQQGLKRLKLIPVLSRTDRNTITPWSNNDLFLPENNTTIIILNSK